jgi:hypothetical protein
MNNISTDVIVNFTNTIEKYEKKNLPELLEGSGMTPSQFKQIVINELKRSTKLQDAFLKNPSSLFASILSCCELQLNPSQMLGEFYFIPYKDTTNTTVVISNGSNIVPLTMAPALYPIVDTTSGEIIDNVPGDIEVFVGGYDTTAIWTTGVDYTEGTIVNVGTYTYRCITSHTSSNTFSNDSANWAFFIGNIRLKKQPYKVFNINNGPYSNTNTDVTFPADFTVDGVSNQLILTNTLAIGTKITVVQTTGTAWDSTTNILDDDSKIAQFIKAQPGIWYSEYKK